MARGRVPRVLGPGARAEPPSRPGCRPSGPGLAGTGQGPGSGRRGRMAGHQPRAERGPSGTPGAGDRSGMAKGRMPRCPPACAGGRAGRGSPAFRGGADRLPQRDARIADMMVPCIPGPAPQPAHQHEIGVAARSPGWDGGAGGTRNHHSCSYWGPGPGAQGRLGPGGAGGSREPGPSRFVFCFLLV